MGRARHYEKFDWEDDPIYQKWKKTVSEKTFQGYFYRFIHWMKFIKLSPTEQRTKRFQDLQSVNPDVNRYFEHKVEEFLRAVTEEERLTASSILNYAKSPMAFFSKGIDSPLRFSKGHIKTLCKRLAKVKGTPRTEIPTHHEIRQIYSASSKWLKPAILLSFQSSFDGNDISKMRIEELFQDGIEESRKHKFVIYNRHKTGIPTFTCLSVEALHDLEVMSIERGRPKEGFLVTTVHDNAFAPEMLNNEFKKVSKKVLGKEYVFKSLRKAHKRAMNNSGIRDPEIKKVMFGHSVGIERNYNEWRQDPTPIIKAYEQIFPNVTVNGWRQAKDDLKAIRENQEMMKKALLQAHDELKSVKTRLDVETEERRRRDQVLIDLVGLVEASGTAPKQRLRQIKQQIAGVSGDWGEE